MTGPIAAAPDLLAAIVAATRQRVAYDAARVPVTALETRAARQAAPRGFAAALETLPHPNVIAECKRRSPSRGVLRWDYDPAAIASGYAAAGAAAVSVLTEPAFFDGSLADLESVRASVCLPVLRKDFIVDRYQVIEARAAGADAILLIVAALGDDDLRLLAAEATALRLDVLVEVHDEAELDRALAGGARVVGVNNRNLRTLAVDIDASERLAARMPRDVIAVAESGLRTGGEIARLQALGYRGFLVGERLVTAADPGRALAEILASVQAGAPLPGTRNA